MIKFLDLKAVNERFRKEIADAMVRTVDSGWYILGEEVAAFEKEYARFISSRHCIGCGNGLEALTLILRAWIEMGRLRKGDEIIVPANTFIASILAISENGLKPVLVEPNPLTLRIDADRIKEALTPKTKAIMIVHLYGRCAFSHEISGIARENNLLIIEDNAQAHGCRFEGQPTGSFGNAAAHSFYPGKNLGALGDAGAVTTDDDALAEMVRTLVNYGSSRKYVFDYCGKNSRLDELQAAVLRIKLRHLESDNRRRMEVARRYYDGIRHPEIWLPSRPDKEEENVWHIFPVFTERRDELQAYLKDKEIQTLIHYPIPPHKQKCYPEWHTLSLPVTEKIHSCELSLPISPVITDEEADRVISAINSFPLTKSPESL